MKAILLIGLGRFGKHIAMELSKQGHDIMAVDNDEEKINGVLRYVTNGQIGDSTKEDFLESLDIPGFDVCIVAIGNDFQSSLETTSLLKELGGKRVIARAKRDAQEKFLLCNGADEVVYPEKELAKWMAIRYSTNHIREYIPLDKEFVILEVDLPQDWIHKTIGEIDIRKKYGVNIMGIRRAGNLQLQATTETHFLPQDTILVLGNYQKLQKYFRLQD